MWLTKGIEDAINNRGDEIVEAINSGNAIRLERIEQKQSEVLVAIRQLKGIFMSHLERITAAVRDVTTKADSLITLTNGLAEKIRELKTDPAALDALAAELESESGELQAAIDANTEPAPPAPGRVHRSTLL